MKSDIITHPGVVAEIESGKITVKVLQASACGKCHAKGACTLGSGEEKYVDIEDYEGGSIKRGDKVTLEMKRSSGNIAVFYGYFLPFLVLLTFLISGSFYIESEGLLAILSIGILIPYYMVLYRYKDKLKRKFNISIKEVIKNDN